MAKVIDFDKFIREKNEETITVKVCGEEILVKAEIPAIVPVMLARAEKADDAALQTKMIMRAADAMLGPDIVDKLCNKGISGKMLATLMEQIFAEINGNDDNEESQDLSDDNSRVTPIGGGNRKK